MPLEACLDQKTRQPTRRRNKNRHSIRCWQNVHEQYQISVGYPMPQLEVSAVLLSIYAADTWVQLPRTIFCRSCIDDEPPTIVKKLAIDLADVLIDKMMSNTTNELF
jgi:hypothetical protein